MAKGKYLEQSRERFLSGIGVPDQGATFEADDFQKEAIEHVVNGRDTLVVAPTGAGKTYIAVEAIQANLHLGKRAIYTTPLKALSNTKYTDFKKRFEPDFSAGLLTGDRKIEVDADVVVATTEIYRNELYQGEERYSMVVLDEVHFLADPQRGPVWEESIILTPSSSTLLMLSASISNAEEIAEWLHSVRGRECAIVRKKERPVELRYGFLHPQMGVLPLRDEKGKIFREVKRFYGSAGVDGSGMKLKGGRFSGGQRRGGRGRSRQRK